MTNDGRRDCVHGFRWCAQCCWSGGRSAKEFLAGVASPPPSTVPGDQGGEPRRPKVGDSVEHSLLGRPEPIEVTAIDLHAFRAVGTDGSRWTIPYKSPHWRWPATQGAAVAGPVCVECGDRGGRWDEEAIDQWYPCRTCETDEPAPPPPASEPPRSYSPSCAGTCWPPCAHHGVEVALFMREDRNRLLVMNADLTAAKAALEVQLAEALRACPRCVAGVCSAHQPLEGQLGNVRDELVETQEALANMTEERDMHQFHAKDVEAERDALAAQLEAAREALTNVRTHAHHMPNCRPGRCAGHCPVLIADALAASGPVKEGG